MITNQSVRKMLSRVAMMLLFMLFTTASAWVLATPPEIAETLEYPSQGNESTMADVH